MKKIFLLLALLCSSLSLSAGPIGEARARQIAEEFFAAHSTRSAGGAVTLSWAGDTITEPMGTSTQLDNALMYIYSRGTNDGFVVVAGDSNVSPIIAYSLDTAINTNNMAEATREILDAWCQQISVARKEQVPMSSPRKATRSSDELLYETALWNQGEPYNREAPVWEGNRSVTGCAATAAAIICHFNRWPDCGVGTTPEYSYYDSYNVLRTIPANTLGRTYDYDNMLLDYNNGYTEEQGNAVAALMKDMGTAIYMSYHYTESGASAFNKVQAFGKYFKYSKEAKLLCLDNYGIETWNNMMRENLRKCGPTYYSGGSNNGGHAFVIDGYSGDYFHINYGWGGAANAWYLLPHIDFYARQAAVMNLVPDRDNSTKYKDNIMLTEFYSDTSSWYGIFSDAKTYEAGNTFTLSVGALNNVGGRDFNGVISLFHCNVDGEFKEEIYSWAIEGFHIGSLWGLTTNEPISINRTIEVGDSIRAYFKSNDSDEWVWIRSWGGFALEQIIICATPEQVSKSLRFHYDKVQQVIYLEGPLALQTELYKPDGSTETQDIDSHIAIQYTLDQKGEYLLKIRSGGEPYVLKLKL